MIIRKAKKEDLSELIKMLVTDKLGQHREKFSDPLPQSYIDAFNRIDADPNQELMVMEDESAEVVGTLQLTFIPYLTYQGGTRALIEAVRIRDDKTGQGLGAKFFEWAINRAKEKGVHLVQLTTDKQRPEAVRFYEKLGFKASHEGMKLHLNK